MFSRPTRSDSSLQNIGENQSLLKGSKYPELVPEVPCYARPSRREPQFQCKKRYSDSVPKGTKIILYG